VRVEAQCNPFSFHRQQQNAEIALPMKRKQDSFHDPVQSAENALRATWKK
jgi:hypothetical protein